MKAKGLVWVGTRTQRFDEMTRFVGDTLGLDTVHEEPGFAVFRLPNGDSLEVFGPDDREHEHFDTGPVVGFLVDEVTEARADLEEAGITFIGPVHVAEDGGSWSHFTGPDGNVYEITAPAPASPRA
jgi:catechol 2,3-dioxygenase-like lactoylglutathione lyase family enzyme